MFAFAAARVRSFIFFLVCTHAPHSARAYIPLTPLPPFFLCVCRTDWSTYFKRNIFVVVVFLFGVYMLVGMFTTDGESSTKEVDVTAGPCTQS